MITYLTGDAAEPVGQGNKIIAHVCNNWGAWGRGFVLSLDRKYPLARKNYFSLRGSKGSPIPLGSVQFVQDYRPITIANMICQDGLRSKNNPEPLLYLSLQQCLGIVGIESKLTEATIHMPKIGTGLGGGSWQVIEGIINKALPNSEVFVYTLPKSGVA